MKLFNYQTQAIQKIRKEISAGHKKIALQMVTGAGKTVIARDIIINAMMLKKKVMFILKGNSLMDQTLKVFREFHHGIIWADRTKNINSKLIFVSAPTYIINRAKFQRVFKEGDIFIIDEAHDCTSSGYKQLLLDIPTERIVLGMSATFYRKSSGQGHEYWDTAIEPVSAKELLDLGRIPELEVFHPPIDYELKNVSDIGGDYNKEQLYNTMKKSKTLYGNILSHYKKLNPDKKPTIAFCINIKHCEEIGALFKDEGLAVLIIHSKLSQEKKQAFKIDLTYHLKNNVPFIICSVDMLSRGVDIPQLEVGLHLAPTKSLIKWRQQVGRLTRKMSKDPSVTEKVTLIDFTPNYNRLGSPYASISPQLDTKQKNRTTELATKNKTKRCEFCNAINQVFFSHCIVCNQPFAKMKTNIQVIEGELRRATVEERDKKVLSFLNQGRHLEKIEKYNLTKEWKYNNIIKKMGEEMFFLSEHIPNEIKINHINKVNKKI